MIFPFKKRTSTTGSAATTNTWTHHSSTSSVPPVVAGDSKDVLPADSLESEDDLSTTHVPGQPKRTGSTIGAFLNIICVIVGTGSLNLPTTFSQAGWIGILLVIISGFIGVFTGVLVIRSLNMMSKGRVRSFNQIGQASFGLFGRIVVYFFHFVYVVGIVGDYIILAGQSFNQLAKEDGHDIGEAAWKVICAIIMWLACISLKQMSEAAWLSLLGFATSMVAILIGIVQAFMHPYNSYGDTPIPHHPAKYKSADGSGVAVALATISFSFCAVVVMPAVEASMKKPQRWNAVVGSSMGVVTATYLFVAVVGYWAFGDQTLSPFLDNLPYNAATKAAKVLISLHVIFASPIMATSFALEMETALNITKERLGKWKEFLCRLVLRTVFFGAMTGVALGIPFFGDVMALVGAFSTSLLLMVIPVLCYIKLRGWRQVPWYTYILGVVVVAIGIYTCVLGAKGAIESLKNDIAGEK